MHRPRASSGLAYFGNGMVGFSGRVGTEHIHSASACGSQIPELWGSKQPRTLNQNPHNHQPPHAEEVVSSSLNQMMVPGACKTRARPSTAAAAAAAGAAAVSLRVCEYSMARTSSTTRTSTSRAATSAHTTTKPAEVLLP